MFEGGGGGGGLGVRGGFALGAEGFGFEAGDFLGHMSMEM